jgi:hypothetical protein
LASNNFTQIDPKRAIPRDEQEKTSKIFVGGVSQEATETDFRQFFAQFGNVLDCTLMMDKDTGRPRGFGFVTFDDDVAVERALSQPLAIHGKPIEVKRAEPRGNLREEGGGGGRGGRFGGAGRGGGPHQANFGAQQDQAAQAGGANNMSPAMMAQYWQRMQQYFQMMQQQMQGGVGVSGVSIAGSVCVEVKVACDGEGVCPRKTEPKMESGIWRKEPLLVGEAARGGALSWPCLAASAVNMSSSIAPALNPGVTC